MEKFKFLFVYDNAYLSNDYGIETNICSKIIEFCDTNGADYQYMHYDDFKDAKQDYNSYAVYYCIEISRIIDLIEFINSYNSSICITHSILSCESSDANQEEKILKINLNEVLKRVSASHSLVSCIKLDEKCLDFFFEFIEYYNSLDFFENNKIIKISNKKVKYYDKTINLQNIFFNSCLKSSCSNKTFKNTVFRDNVYTVQGLSVKSTLSDDNFKNHYSIPRVVYETLQNSSIKSENHNFFINHYFDKIFLLYLKRRDNKAIKQLQKHNITNYTLVEGIDGKNSINCISEWNKYQKLPPLERETHALNGKKRRAIGSTGSWAILKSMYNIIAQAKQKKYSRILILQDDVIFHNNFVEEFRKKLKYIKEDWKLLYLGASQHYWDNIEILNGMFYHANGSTDGAFAVGIHCSVYDMILKNISEFLLPFDSGALWEVQKKYSSYCYVLYNNIVIADLRFSDLRKSRNMENFSKLFRWELEHFSV